MKTVIDHQAGGIYATGEIFGHAACRQNRIEPYPRLVNSKPETDREDFQLSPTVLRSGPYRFYFVSHDLREPPHVHVDRDDLSAKFWLQPLRLAFNLGFPPRELRKLEALTSEHQQNFLEAWYGYFGTESR